MLPARRHQSLSPRESVPLYKNAGAGRLSCLLFKHICPVVPANKHLKGITTLEIA